MSVSVGTAYVDILPKVSAQFGNQLAQQISNPVEKAAGAAAGAAGKIEQSFGGTFKRIAGLAAGAFGAISVGKFFTGAIHQAQEANKIMADTEAVIASTGGVAGVTAKQVESLANAIARKTGVDHEQIAGAENLLLTFTQVHNEVGKGNDIFNQATQAAVDMAARFGGDASSAAVQLGKALNNPVQGLLALRRVGISFTQQQQDQIKTMVEHGNLLGAQKAILAELAKETAGSAAAQGNAADKMKESFRQLQETIGRALLPVIASLQQKLQGLFDWFANAPGPVKELALVLGSVAAAIIGVKLAIDAWKVAQAALNTITEANPWVKLATVIIAVGTAFYEAYKHSETFRDVVNAVVQAVVNAVGDGIGWILDGIDKFIGALATAAEAATHLPVIGDKFKGVADTLRGAQHDVQGWADALHSGINITGAAADAAGNLAQKADKAKGAVGGLGDQSATTTEKLPLLTAALVAAGVAVKGVNDAAGQAPAGLDAWAKDVQGKIGSALDPLKQQAKDVADTLSFSDVKKKLESGQEWEAAYNKLGAAAKAGLEPAKNAAKQTAQSLGDILSNVTRNNAATKAWLDDLTKLGGREGGRFQPLAAELAKLGPDAAEAVHQAVGASGGTLDKLQNAFGQRAKLMSDPMIQGLEDALGGPGVVNVGALAVGAFGKGWRDQIPALADALTKDLHDSLVGAGPVLTSADLAKYLFGGGLIPGVTPGVAGPPSPGMLIPGVTAGVAGPPSPGMLIPGVTRGVAGPPSPGLALTPGITPGVAGPPAPGIGTVVNVNVQTNASPSEIANTVGDHLAWRLAPQPMMAG